MVDSEDLPMDPRDALVAMNDEPYKYALVGCGQQKQESRNVMAKDLYTSNYFQLKREYAETCCYSWTILSAKFGCITPNCHVDHYDVTLDDYPNPDDAEFRTLDEWSESVQQSLHDTFSYLFNDPSHPDEYELVVLCGQQYIDEIWLELQDVEFLRMNVELRFPFEETGGIGEQMGWLRARIDEKTEDPNQTKFSDIPS